MGIANGIANNRPINEQARGRKRRQRIPATNDRAWNAGDGDTFASSFSDSADLVAFEGMRLKGRASQLHQGLFGTVVRIPAWSEMKFVRLVSPELA